MKFSSTYFKRANESSVPKIGSAKKDNAKEKVKKQKNSQGKKD